MEDIKTKNNRIKKQRTKSIWKSIILVILLLVTSIIVISSIYIYMNLQSLPKVDRQQLNTYETSKIVDKDNNIIWQPTDKRIGLMKYDQIPELYKNTLIQVEDKDYWTNKGYSTKGILNMALSVVKSKIDPSVEARGGSTLEQQLIKNIYFNRGNGIKTTTRKIQEIYLSRQLNHNFTKKEILEYYVNHLSFAEGDTGVSAIMMTYFGKNPSDYIENTTDNIAEQAYIVGLGQNPTLYNIYENPEGANARKNTVLSVMLDSNLISETQYKDALEFDLTTVLKPRYWESEMQRELNLKYKPYTDQVLSEISDIGYNINEISLTINTYMNRETFDTITDVVRQEQYYQDSKYSDNPEQVGVAVIDFNGVVQGMVGSRFEQDELNRSIQRTRSSGSSTKPFTAYGPLLQYLGNQYTTASSFNSNSYLYPGTNLYMNNWGNFNYGNVDIQRALRLSLNGVVARIDDEVLGSTRMKTFLNGVGLDTKESYSAIDGIGLYISPLDAAAAYNAINNKGVYIEPKFIKSITFTDGSVKELPEMKTQVMNESTAYVLSQMLKGTLVTGYTAVEGAIPQYDGYAAKTGTVGLPSDATSPNIYGDGGSDSWYDSITNNGYSISVWFGYDTPNTSPQVSDSFKGPLHLGRDLQKMLNGDKAIPNWTKPDTVRVLSGTGINTHYAITDSKDITSNDIIQVPAISATYDTINDIKTVSNAPNINPMWETQIDKANKPFYNLYVSDPTILNNIELIPNSLYNLLGDE